MKKFNTSLHGNLEKTKEILILSERSSLKALDH